MNQMHKVTEDDHLMMQRILFSQDILGKKFVLYSWITAKNNIMLAINSLFFGLAYMLFSRSSAMTFVPGLSLVALALIFISISIIHCLIIVVPTMESSLWKRNGDKLIVKNPRTVIGINKFDPNDCVELINTIDYIIFYDIMLMKF